MQIGCQTYTWEMLGAEWRGSTAAILDAIAAAGYAGLEITQRMTGEWQADAAGLAAACRARALNLVTLAFSSPSGFTDPDAVESDLQRAKAAIAYAKAAGCQTFGLSGAAIRRPGEAHTLPTRPAARRLAATLYNEIGGLAAAAGLIAHLHPSSHHGSVIETEPEYDDILAMTEPSVVHFGPDLGHMLRGDIDPLPYLRRFRDRIVHVHLKDVDAAGAWVALGSGRLPVTETLAWLVETGYAGWVMLEEEAESARHDPAGAVARNRAWLCAAGY